MTAIYFDNLGENEMSKIEQAIISVTDKTGITDFARSIADLRVEILSTGGTAKVIREAGIPVLALRKAC